MKKIILVILFAAGSSFFIFNILFAHKAISTTSYDADEESSILPNVFDDSLDSWTRPPGPPRVGLQVGHWKAAELPDELKRLRGHTGSQGGGKHEWEVNMAIAEHTKTLLEQRGITVDILPATVPVAYVADAFVSIHADGSLDPSKSGYKAAAPRRDRSGKAEELASAIDKSYEVVGLEKDPNITRNMLGYYAFSYRRFDHAIHPMTPSAIVETGFLTNASDRQILINSPEVSARAVADGILEYLGAQNLLASQ